jgi:hypothetical protein
VRQRDEPTGAEIWQRDMALALAEIWAKGGARAVFGFVLEYVSIYNRFINFWGKSAQSPAAQTARRTYIPEITAALLCLPGFSSLFSEV